MPEAGLLKRVKSWRSKRKDSQSSHLDALDSQESQSNSAQFPSEEPPANLSSPALVVKPPAEFANRDGFIRGGSDQRERGQHEASSMIQSSAGGYNALPEGCGIGLAIGSPHENPLPRATSKHVDGEALIPSSLIESPTIVRDHCSPDLAEQKKRRWRAFTGIFNKKDLSSSLHIVGKKDHSYQQKPNQNKDLERGVSLRQVVPSHHSWDAEYAAGVPQAMSPPLRSLTRLESLVGEDTGSRRQIGWRKSQLGRTHGKEGVNLARNESRTWLLSHSSRKGSKPPQKDIITNRNASLPNAKNETLLQVEIPNFKMERYSVMFSNLLPHNQSLSLLARRQGRLAEIKLVPDERSKITNCSGDLELPQSDQQTGSHSPYILSCAPTASPKSCTRLATLGSSPIFHSHLAADTSLTTNSKIEGSDCRGQTHLMVLVHTPADSVEEDASLEGSSSRSSPKLDIIISPRSPSECSSPEPTESAGLVGSVATNWATPAISLTPPSRKIARRNDARPSHCASPWVALDQETANHDTAEFAIAEIAVARQVSVSKRQRQRLVPIIPRQVRQPKQPKLVDGEQDAKSRKSHYLTIEEP